MRICKVWDGDYPWDIRVHKVVHSLASAGHAVHLVCRNQGRRVRHERTDACTIQRLPILPTWLGPAHAALNFPFPFNPAWIAAIARGIRASQAELILVRDLPLALPAALLGRAHRIPVIFDMAENYPAMLEDRVRYTPTGPLGRLVRRPLPARLAERLAVRLVDHIVVVVEESLERLQTYGVEGERLSIVSNTPRLDQWDLADFPRPLPTRNGKVNLVYFGNLDGIRGVDLAIRAVRRLQDLGRSVRLSVVGDGPSLQGLRALAGELGVSDRVAFEGRLSLHDEAARNRVQTIMARSHVGLIPHYDTEACNTTVSNKLFDYMLLGLPVIVSDVKPTARIVRAEECGDVFRDRDEADLVRSVIALEQPEIRQRMAEKGRAAIHRRYNWDYDARVLLETIQRVAARSAQRHLLNQRSGLSAR